MKHLKKYCVAAFLAATVGAASAAEPVNSPYQRAQRALHAEEMTQVQMGAEANCFVEGSVGYHFSAVNKKGDKLAGRVCTDENGVMQMIAKHVR